MPRAPKPDVFAMFDPILHKADCETSPWENGRYVPEVELLRELLSVPISTAEKQESGRVAKALDAWVAHELRRAGFPPDAVWPRTRRPRVLPDDAAPLEEGLALLARAAVEAESGGEKIQPPALRRAIRALDGMLPGASERISWATSTPSRSTSRSRPGVAAPTCSSARRRCSPPTARTSRTATRKRSARS